MNHKYKIGDDVVIIGGKYYYNRQSYIGRRGKVTRTYPDRLYGKWTYAVDIIPDYPLLESEICLIKENSICNISIF